MVPSFEKRVRAFSIDTSGVAVFAILALAFNDYGHLSEYIVIGAAILFYLVPYFISNGQSFGKRIQKIKIVKVDDTNAPLWLILLREIFKITLSVSTFGAYLVISFFVMSDKTSRTIHDYIFKTKMIDLKPENYSNNVLGTSESLKKRGL